MHSSSQHPTSSCSASTACQASSASVPRTAQARSHNPTIGTHVPTARTHSNTVGTQIVRSGRPFSPRWVEQANGHGVTSQQPTHPSPCSFFPSLKGGSERTTVDRMARARAARKKTRILNLAELESASSFSNHFRHQAPTGSPPSHALPPPRPPALHDGAPVRRLSAVRRCTFTLCRRCGTCTFSQN